MSISPLDYKKQANEFYSKQQWSSTIDAYSKAIDLIQTTSDESVPLYLLYLNRSCAYIQEKNFYDGYQDARQSLKLKAEKNGKGSYCAGICAYHLGFIESATKFADQAIKDQQEKSNDYFDLKLLIEKKVKSMKRWRKNDMTANKSLDKLEQILHQDLSIIELPPILYQIRHLLRAAFDDHTDKKLMNIDTSDLGVRLQQLSICFAANINIERMIKRDPLFEDLILYEMPDVGKLRLKAYRQGKRSHKLIKQSWEDLAALEFSFFINNILSSLAAQSIDAKIRLRALKQIHRLMTIDLYRESIGDSLSMSIHNYIYCRSNDSKFVNEFHLNGGIDILFNDCIDSFFQSTIIEIIKRITTDQWRNQSKKTIQLVLKQISQIIKDEDIVLLKPKEMTTLEFQLHDLFGSSITVNDCNDHLNLIINVLTKILYIFGKEPFARQSLVNRFYLFNHETWLEQFPYEKHRTNIPFLIYNWFEHLKQWLKFDDKKIAIDRKNAK